MKLIHGGDWAGFEARYGRAPLDFSVNVSPLGVPDGVRRAIERSAGQAERYPDPLCRALRKGIAEKEGVQQKHILCGNGAADLIFRAVLASRPRRALVPIPTFAEYEAALQAMGCQIEYYTLSREKNFTLDGGILEVIRPDTDVVFVCQPNNPTGVTVPRPLLLQILEQCRAVGALLVIDECFCNFLDEPAACSLTGELSKSKHLLILRSFTKLYAMAGVRLGYCLSADTALLEAMASAGPPWPVSYLAQAAGLAALEETDYVHQVRELTRAERPRLAVSLERLGLRVIPGEANYLLFQCHKPLVAPLAERDILLRECGNYRGLDKTWYRVSVRTRAENERLIGALREVLNHG